MINKDMDILTYTEELVEVEVVITKKNSRRRPTEIRPYKLTEERTGFLKSLVTPGRELSLVPKKINVLFALTIFNKWNHDTQRGNKVYASDKFTAKRLWEAHDNVIVNIDEVNDYLKPEILTKDKLEGLKAGDVIYCNTLNDRNMKRFMDIASKVDVKIVSKEIKMKDLEKADEIFIFTYKDFLEFFNR